MALATPDRTDLGFLVRTGRGKTIRSDDFAGSTDRPPLEIANDYPSEVEIVEHPIPVQLISRYALLARHRAMAEELEDGSGWFASVPLIAGVWGTGESESEALDDLQATVKEWVTLKMQLRHLDIPILSGLDLNR